MAYQTKQKANRRADLLKAAREIFAVKGFEAATVSEIVARAGVAQGTFYLYFPSKASIVLALTQEVQEQIQAAIFTASAQASTLSELIEACVREAFRITGQYREVLSVIQFATPWSQDPNERGRILQPYYGIIAELIRQEQEKGQIDSQLDAFFSAQLVVGLVHYGIYECYIYNPSDDIERYMAEIVRFIHRALGVR